MSDYQMVGPGHYTRYNPMNGVKTEIFFKDGKMTVRHSQRIDKILDANHEQASNFRGYDTTGVRQVARLPVTEWNKLKLATGWKEGQGHDQVALRRYLNDRDNYKLRTIPKAV